MTEALMRALKRQDYTVSVEHRHMELAESLVCGCFPLRHWGRLAIAHQYVWAQRSQYEHASETLELSYSGPGPVFLF